MHIHIETYEETHTHTQTHQKHYTHTQTKSHTQAYTHTLIITHLLLTNRLRMPTLFTSSSPPAPSPSPTTTCMYAAITQSRRLPPSSPTKCQSSSLQSLFFQSLHYCLHLCTDQWLAGKTTFICGK